jgi:hypothetical protein
MGAAEATADYACATGCRLTVSLGGYLNRFKL